MSRDSSEKMQGVSLNANKSQRGTGSGGYRFSAPSVTLLRAAAVLSHKHGPAVNPCPWSQQLLAHPGGIKEVFLVSLARPKPSVSFFFFFFYTTELQCTCVLVRFHWFQNWCDILGDFLKTQKEKNNRKGGGLLLYPFVCERVMIVRKLRLLCLVLKMIIFLIREEI